MHECTGDICLPTDHPPTDGRRVFERITECVVGSCMGHAWCGCRGDGEPDSAAGGADGADGGDGEARCGEVGDAEHGTYSDSLGGGSGQQGVGSCGNTAITGLESWMTCGLLRRERCFAVWILSA